MSLLKEKLEKGDFVVTSEIGPPKGVNIEPYLEEADKLKGKVTAINVTDIQSAVMRLGSLAVCHLLKERGIEPVYQLVTRDRNRLALQSDLLSAYVLGIENVLCLTGDHPVLGDHPQAKPVYDLDSVQLLKAAKSLNEGEDMVGNPLEGRPQLFLGAVVNPGIEPLEPQIIKMKKKISAGAQFFQTQPVYEVDKFARFVEKVKDLGVPILAGVVLLKSAKMAKYMNENVSGVNVPQELIEEMASVSKEDRPKKSVEIAVRLIRKLKPLCQGIHIMPLGWDRYVPDILKGIDLA
ncbi:MAG TPA: 5,10-methylenetetrahydrofolate reductase [Candidatus Omnitrophica bacterium]|nr:MAG: 5,10-methylenetetrahydrofolate reductase [Candidatus Omnitrophota bacterium]HEC68926.1 5,10-methylenetetrahydrofolate reductase [Candidatus Omnitrophota bacterium]